jgi:hypothetical protein
LTLRIGFIFFISPSLGATLTPVYLTLRLGAPPIVGRSDVNCRSGNAELRARPEIDDRRKSASSELNVCVCQVTYCFIAPMRSIRQRVQNGQFLLPSVHARPNTFFTPES